MLAFLTNLFTSGLARQLREAYEARLRAENDGDRITADIQIATLEERQANRALGGRITAIVQAAWAAPFIIYHWKLLVWDKVLASGVTDPLSPELLQMQALIAGLYFGGAAVVGVVKAVKR